MKKIVLSLGLVLSLVSYALASSGITKNAYQISTKSSPTMGVSTTVTFPYESRNLVINNGDSSDGVWVDITGTVTTCSDQVAGCSFIPAGDELALYDFGTNSINIITYVNQASPVVVTVTY